MATHWKKQLADAHQRNRELLNQVHELEQKLVAKDSVIDGLSNALTGAKSAFNALQASISRPPLSDIELFSLQSLVLSDAAGPSEAKTRLMDELRRRGILTSEIREIR